MSRPKFATATVFFLIALCWARLSDAAGLTFQWDPPTDGATTGYILFAGTAPGVYSNQINVGAATSYRLDGVPEGGTYYFAIAGYDANGGRSSLSNEVSATIPNAAPSVVTGLALAPSVPSPQVVGTAVTWLATATGGVTPYQYQWAIYQSGQWTVGPWTSSSSTTWTPSTAGDYQARVAVRSAGSTSITGELTRSAPFTITAASTTTPPPTGALTVTVSASLHNGRDRTATIKVKARNGNQAASGAAITVAIRSPQGVVTTLSDTAGNDGSATLSYPLNANDRGAYQVQVTATSNGATGTVATTFTIH